MSKNVEKAALAILREARDANQRLTTTYLVKYIYLLDVLVARETEGESTWTGLPWKFLHFGPWSADVATALDSLAGKGLIESEEATSVRGDKDYRLYWLDKERSAPSLEALGVPSRARIDLEQFMRSFDSDLSGLLNFVYFKTEPMRDARPGDGLTFSHCRRTPHSDVKPIAMKPIDRKRAEAVRQKLRAAMATRKESSIASVWKGPHDEVYEKGLAALEGEALSSGSRGRGQIDL